MKTYSQLPLSLLFFLCTLVAFGQELQSLSDEASSSWKQELEKLTQPHQTSLSFNAGVTTASGNADPTAALESVKTRTSRLKQLQASKSAELSKQAWAKQLEEYKAMKEQSGKRKLATDKSKPAYELNKNFAQSKSEATALQDDLIRDDYADRLHKAIHEKNLREQEQIIKEGKSTSNKRVAVGAKTGLEIDEKEYAKLKEEAANKVAESMKRSLNTETRFLDQYSPTNSKEAYEQFKNQTSSLDDSQSQNTYSSVARRSSLSETSTKTPLYRSFRASLGINGDVPASTIYDTLNVDGYPTIDITDNGEGIGTVTFTTDYVYRFIGLCFVNDGQVLTINPGAVVKGYQFQSVPSMLIVAKGGKINALGTASSPIIFTAESDQIYPPATSSNLLGSYDQYTTGLWGGIALLGDGLLNNNVGEVRVLGDGTDIPVDDPRLEFGGEDINSDVGNIMEYVSIRHTGELFSEFVSGTEYYFDGFEYSSVSDTSNHWTLNDGGGLGSFAISTPSFSGASSLSTFIGNVSTNESDISIQSEDIFVDAGQTYDLSVQAYSFTVDYKINLVVLNSFGEEIARTEHFMSSVETWETIPLEFYTDESVMSVAILLADPVNAGLVSTEVYFDDVVLTSQDRSLNVGLANGLTVAGVDNGAVLNHIEVIGAADDAFEFLGGYANANNLISVYAGDDGFDTDMGYNGKLQFLFGTEAQGFHGEHDGGDPEETSIGEIKVYNATYIGNGEGSTSQAALLRDNTGGYYYQSIFQDFGIGIEVEYLDGISSSYDKIQNGTLNIKNNLFWNVGFGDYLSVNDPSGTFTGDIYNESAISNLNDDPVLDDQFVPGGGQTFTFFHTGDPFYTETNYAGAFAPGETPWYDGWSMVNASEQSTGLEGGELVFNGDFELGGEFWTGNALNIQSDGANNANYTYLDTAGNAWDANISQPLEIIQDQTYILSFDAKTDEGTGSRTMLAGIGLNVEPFDAQVNEVTLSPVMETYTLELTASGFGGVSSRVLFDMGADVGEVVIDNVSLRIFTQAEVDINLDDYNALLALKNALGGELLNWWLESTPPSQWPGVNLNEEGRVVHLDLEEANISGNIPVALTNLTALEWISLGGNSITGLPEGISSLPLAGLSLWSNDLQSLPSDFFNLAPTLQLLDLGGNAALGIGVLSDAYGTLTNLHNLYLWGMEITELPANITNLSRLRLLNLDGNPITSLPENIGSMDSLVEFSMSNTALQSLPASFSDLDLLKELNLRNNNNNTADISIFWDMDSLKVLDASANNLSGTLEGISGASNLEYIYLGENRISGGIPAEISALTNLQEFSIHDNSLNGALSAELFELPNLYQIELYSNQLTGGFPDTQGSESITSIAIGGNNLETLGASIGNFPNLVFLDLNENNFSGNLPVALAQNTSLEDILLAYNQFTGAIPVEWTTLPNLRGLFLTGNQLDAPLPEEIGNMSSLLRLAVDQNQIPGAFPESFSGMTQMLELYIYQNQLESLPDLSGLTELYSFYAFENNLEFDDFEPVVQLLNSSLGNFGISPQNEPAPSKSIVELGSEIVIDASVGGTRNHYNWYFNGNFMESAGDVPVLNIADFTLEDMGVYWCEVSNDSVTSNTDLYLSSGEREYWINAPVSEADSMALVDIYYATGGENWNNPENWLIEPVVQWAGVFIENGRVVKLDLYDQNLQGGLPPAVGDLDALQWISLFNNPGMGFLPGEFFGLSNLHYLDLDNTGLTQLSPAIEQLNALDTLWLGRNPMEGEVPTQIFNLSNLRLLGLYRTNFQGELPAEITQLTNLEGLWLNDNSGLYGDLPAGFSNLSGLTYLNVSFTPFSGGFEQVGSLSELEWLFAYGVPALEIELPDEFVNLTKLEHLGLADGNYEIRGIPNEIFEMRRLKSLRMVRCNVNSAIPAEFSNLDSLTVLSLNYNGLGGEISGALPTDFNVEFLEEFYISGNRFSSLPPLENAPNLRRFYAVDNKLDFADLAPLTDYFNSHIIYDDYDVSFMRSPNREYVELSVGAELNLDPPLGTTLDSATSIQYYKDDEFIGEPIDNFGSLTFRIPDVANPASDGLYDAYVFSSVLTPLTDLQVHLISREVQVLEKVILADSAALADIYNHFGGEPQEVFGNWGPDTPVENWNGVEAADGRVIGLYLPGLEGTIPGQSIAALDGLKWLSMTEGYLTGDIPAEIFIPGLEFMDFGRNELTGSIPNVPAEADTSLYFLGLAGNYLSGAIPESLGNYQYLSEIYLDDNELSGAIPSSFTQLYLSGFSVDRNELSSIPEGLAFSLEGASYVNFEANNFDVTDLINGSGNYVPADNSYEFQGSTRAIYWEGDPSIGGQITLKAERLHPADEFFWFYKDKGAEETKFNFIDYTGSDSSIVVGIDGDWAQTSYMAVVANPEYQYGEYPFLSYQTPVDTYNRRFVTSQTNASQGVVGFPDSPPIIDQEFGARYPDHTLYNNSWDANQDTISLRFDNDPIPINYLRLHGVSDSLALGVYALTLHGTGGETLEMEINQYISSSDQVLDFPRTSFAVNRVDLRVLSGNIDAFEIGDNGAPNVEIPLLDDTYTDVGPDYINIEVIYNSLADYIAIERSADGETFEEIAQIGYTGWFYDEVVPGKYYYRARAVFTEAGITTPYSEILETGNCVPILPGDKLWAGKSELFEDSNFQTFFPNPGIREEVVITAIDAYGEYYISDLSAGIFDQFFGFDTSEGTLKERCDIIDGISEGRISQFIAEYDQDTLSVEWWDFQGVHGLSKFWVVGDQPIPDVELQRPSNMRAALLSKQSIELSWLDDQNPEGTVYTVQRSIGVSNNYQDIATLTNENSYRDTNTLDGGLRYYRVVASFGDNSSYPSNEASIIHKAPLFDFLENTVTQDITRQSYGGAWGDFDGDGDDDLYVSNAFEFGKNFLYENTGNGTFRKVVGTTATAEAGFNRTAAWGDYNNDGFLDIYSPEGRWAGTPEGTTPADDIFRNTGSKSFVKANEAAMSQTVIARSEGGVWVDLNNDGWLDLVKSTGYVLLNDGTGILVPTATLLEFSGGTLVESGIYFWSVSNVDIDNDGDQDIYFTSDTQNMLFLNDGSGALTYTENLISNSNLRSRGFAWADFDNDGWMDLLTGETDPENFGIYRNLGGGEFVFIDAADSEGEDDNLDVGRGYTVGDFNNDGLIDVMLNIEGRAALAMNEGFFNFVDVPIQDQAFPVTSRFSHVSVADVNQDGYLDVFLPNQDPRGGNYMFLNNATAGNSWVTVKLKGITSNRSGIGARVTVSTGTTTQTQQVISQNGLGSGNSLGLEFGLGSASTIDAITVYWPSGEITTAESVSANQVFSMVEIPESSNTGPTVNVNDSTVLRTLYQELGGVNWTRQQGWLEGSPLGWEGTFWSNPGPDSNELPRLVSLILNDNNLNDTIPAAITTLTSLEVLDLSGNNLSGSIPATLGSMTSLVNLTLNDNDLTGKIPASVGNLTNLENLDLYNNQLFGELPRSLGGLQALKQFEIYNNDFIGFVPEVIGTLDNLEILRMEHNEFEGALPAGLGDMESLSVLYLYDNAFTGELPAALGNLSQLVDLRIQNNEFFGELPSTFTNLTGIEYVDISNNQFEGSLEVFSGTEFLYYFDASSNQFTDLGDYTNASAEMIINVTNNWLDFGDFDPNELLILRNRLEINPQDSLYERQEVLHAVGEQIIIEYDIAGSGNEYTWLINEEPLEGDANVSIAGSSVDIISPDSPNEGVYVLQVTNPNYPDMTLVTSSFELKLTSLERDKRALLAFKEAVQNTYNLSNWTESSELTSDWTGVEVTGDRVTALVLPATETQTLKGNIPASFADLTGIVTLDLSGNELSRLPDISNWPSVETVNVSRNRFKFGSLVANVKLGSKITYSPQRRFGEVGAAQYDTLEAGDDPRIIVENQGFGATYQWKFGPFIPGQRFNDEVSNLPDANSRVYQIENLDYDQMGTYRVEATHPDVPGLTLQSRNKNIMAATTIFGTVYADNQNTLLTAGEVITFRKTPSGPFVAEDTVAINSSGEYQFADVVLGDFLLLTKPNRNAFPIDDSPGSFNVVDSYYESAELFENANTLEVREKNNGVDISLINYRIPEPELRGADFEGELFSNFEEDSLVDEEAEQRILARKRVKRAACSMRRYVGSGRVGQEDDEFELYAYVESDDEGRFNFTDVEEGLYRLNIQYPGVPMDPDSDIEFEVGGDKENQLFTIVAEINEDGIVVEAEEVLYTIKPYIKDVQLYPNPTEGKMKADFLVYRKINDLKMNVMDTRGLNLFEEELSPRMGVQSTEIDLTNYQSGVYFIEFTDEAGTFRHQVKVTKK